MNVELEEMKRSERELDNILCKAEMAMQGGFIENPLIFVIIPPVWAFGCLVRKLLRMAIAHEESQ